MQKFGGVSRYHYEIIKNLQKDKSINIKLPIVCAENFYFQDTLKYFKKLPFGQYALNSEYMKLYMHLFGNKIDILHPTYYDVKYLSDREISERKYKLVITVHDMIHEIFIKDNVETLNNKKRLIEVADGIIAVSECTKKDLLSFFPQINANKIKVIYHGCSINPNSSKKIKLPEKYILFVGSRDNYKNAITLFNAMPDIIRNNKGIKLVCAGGGDFSEKEKEIFTNLGISDYVEQHNMTDEELSFAYSNAKAFIFPSKYEGFGIPILEAFNCRCPIVLANASCFPEIAQDAAIYFEPDNSQELSQKVRDVINNNALRGELINKGTERAKYFSWEKAAKETLEYYKTVIGK
jgi:glycosyltransferase involved in cell wall biosynthesis